LFCKAGSAKHWPVLSRLERYDGTLTTCSANDACLWMQFDASVFSCDSAIQTSSWGIRELLLVKETLLVRAEDEFASALYAR
jgi:hypothetical protein